MKTSHLKSILLSSLVMLLISCGGSKKPGAVTERFLKAVNEKDFKAAREYATPETGKLIDLMEQLQKMSDSADSLAPVDFEIVSEKIEGDEAIVEFREKGDSETDEIRLKKSDGKWLVNITKQDLAAKDAAMTEEGESGIFGSPDDSLETLESPSDSVAIPPAL